MLYDPNYFCHTSSGRIVIDNDWMFLYCDQEIVNYYHWLTCRYGISTLKSSRRGAHISFVKRETVTNKQLWRALMGTTVEFKYSNMVRWDNNYHVWVDVELAPFNKIRNNLGLPDYRSFHITIGQLKYKNE